MKHYILFLFSFLVLSSCVMSQTKGGDQKTSEPSCAVKVNFGSAGGGIDLKTYDAVKKMISDKKLKFTEKNMGREGEKEICLPLKELKRKKKTEFIEQLKKTASSGQYVSVSNS